MPKTVELLSPGKLIAAASALVLASLLAVSLSALRMPDSGGHGQDSFGTRGDGFRGVYELLEELQTAVRRDGAPPQSSGGVDETIALMAPDAMLVAANPVYLQRLVAWIERGGRLVVAPRGNWEDRLSPVEQIVGDEPPTDVFDALGLDDHLSLQRHIMETPPREEGPADDDDSVLPERLREALRDQSRPNKVVEVVGTGMFADAAIGVTRLAIPADAVGTLKVDSKRDAIAGTLSMTDADGDAKVLAAAVQRGDGQIIVISEPALLANQLLARADNSVLAVRALSPAGQGVAFDEFYHGLGVRGNPLYLLTRPGFAAVTTGLLAVVALWAWRGASFLGPPLAEQEPSRRDIGEYIGAMAQFFRRAPDSGLFLLREMRDGVLRELCRKLNLPLDMPDSEAVVAALARRHPQRAAALRVAVAEADAELARDGVGMSPPLPLMQRLTSCL